jgi:hypothetical protein
VEDRRQLHVPFFVNTLQFIFGLAFLCHSVVARPKSKNRLSLPLFMFGVDANHPHHSLAVDDLALVAHFLY